VDTELNRLSCPIAGLERLLLSTDGSEFSEGAIREAIKIAERCSSKLYALSVIETNPEFEALAPKLVEKAGKETREHLESVKARASRVGVDCEVIVHQGEEPYHFIVEEALRRRAEMIIMGRRGRTGLKRLMMGSVTAKVIGHAPCDVLVVPRAARIEFKNILTAIDGSRYSDSVASDAIGIAKRYNGKVLAVCVASTDSEIKESKKNVDKVRLVAEKEGLTVETVCEKGTPYEVIVNRAKEKNADLIVMGSHGRTGLKRLLMGSVTERVIGHAECAVLVVKEKSR